MLLNILILRTTRIFGSISWKYGFLVASSSLVLLKQQEGKEVYKKNSCLN